MNSKDYVKLAQLCAAIQERSDKKHTIIAEILQREGNINCPVPPQSCAKRQHENSVSYAALHAALDSREIEVFDTLLRHGADFTARNDRGETILHQAVANSCLKYANCWKIKGRLEHPFVDSLLLAHVNSDNHENPRDRHGISYFHAACMTNNRKAVEFYLSHGVSPNEAVSADSTALAGYTPLHLAARYCCLDTTEVLLRFGADARLKAANGLTALHLLTERNMEIVDWMQLGRRACYDQLIADFEDNERAIEAILEGWKGHDDIGLTRLHVACTIYDHARIEELLGELVDLERAVDADSTIWPGYTALHFAAHFNVETVKLLTKNGANILAKDAKGVTPFDLCLERYEAEDMCYLIANHPSWKYVLLADTKIRLSDLVFAMRSAKGFKAFLERLPSVDIAVPKDSPLWPGCTPLHLATIFPERSRDLVDLLAGTEYSHGEENERRSYYNCSPAREKLYLQRIQVCLLLGAEPTSRDARNSSPLQRAFRLRRESAVSAFLRNLRPENHVDDGGLSHLHIACAAQRRDVIDKLLDERNVNEPVPASFRWFIRPYYWDTSSYLYHISAESSLLHIAVTCENADLAELLLRRGADAYARDVNGLTPIHRLFVIRSRNNAARHLFAAESLRDCVLEPGGLSHLHVASLMSSRESVAKLLDAGADVNCRIAYAESPTTRRKLEEHLAGNPAFDLYEDASPEPLSFLGPYSGYTPLHFALENQDAEVVKLLVERGADVLARKPDDSAPLYTVLDSRYLGLADFFVRKLRGDAKLRERMTRESGVTMLHVACATLDADWARGLLDDGADVNAQTCEDSPVWPGCAPLHLLSTPVSQDEKDKIGAVIELLLQRGADVTMMNAKMSSPVHRLYSFIESYVDNHSHVDALLAAHKDYSVNPVNSKGLSHFHVACARNKLGIVSEFLKHGKVDVNHAVDHFHTSFGGYTSLHVAVYKDCPETIDLLLRHGADVNAEDRHGNTPLHVAAERDDISRRLIERIIKGGANIHAKNLLGKTLLEILLIKWTDVPGPIVELFLAHGWRPNTFNPISDEGILAMAFSTSNHDLPGVDKPAFRALVRAEGIADLDDTARNAIHNIVSTQQPQHKNSAEDYADAVEALVRLGCDYDHQDDLGRTPLHLAVQFRQIAAIAGLLQSGADVNILDASGRPALSYILQYVHKRLMHDRDIVVSLAVHLRKMVRLGLDVGQVNVETLVAARKAFPFSVLVDKEFDEALERLKGRRISSTRFGLRDFLSETGAVSSYPYATPQERLAMQRLFEGEFESLRREFPEVAGFMRLQYRKARARPPLIDPAIASLRILLGFELPVLCSDVVLKFLRNEDLRNLIAAADLQLSLAL